MRGLSAIMRLAVLLGLLIGAGAPIFRHDVEAHYVSAACLAILALLATIALFPPSAK
jgi:hypothetical protein